MQHFTVDLTGALRLNYPEFSDSCLFCQLSIRKHLFDVVVDGAHVHIIQYSHHLLSQPEVFILIAHFHGFITAAGRRDKCQILGGGRTYADVSFLSCHGYNTFLTVFFE